MTDPDTSTANPAAPPEGSRGQAHVPPIPLGDYAGLSRAQRAVRFLTDCAKACEAGQTVELSRELILRVLGKLDVEPGLKLGGPPMPRVGQTVGFFERGATEPEPAVVTRVHSEFTVSVRVLPHEGTTFCRRLLQKEGSQQRIDPFWNFLEPI